VGTSKEVLDYLFASLSMSCNLNLGSFVKNMFWYAKVIIIDGKNKQKTK
jgi:hypothetical protein